MEPYNMESAERRPKSKNYGVCGFWCLMMLFFIIASLVFAIVYLTVIENDSKPVEVSTPTPEPTPVKSTVCNSLECVTLASSLIERMDSSLEPCVDFYDYACGSWIKNTKIPEGYGKATSHSPKMDRQRALRTLLETPGEDEPEAITKAKALYESCMNKETREANGVTVINTGVETVFGGWPVLENNLGGKFNASNFDMTALIAGLFVNDGSTSLLRATTVYDTDDSNFRLNISAGTMTGLPSEKYLVEDKYREERTSYLKYMTDVAVLLGAHPDVATPEMQAIINLEQRLAQAKLNSTPTPDEIITVADMKTKYPLIDWTQYLTTLIPPTVATITDEFEVINYDSEYLTKALMILDNEPPRLISDWMLWLFYHDATLYLNDAIRNVYYEFVEAVQGIPQREYYQDCVDLVDLHLHSVAERLYSDEFFPSESVSLIQAIVDNVKTALSSLITESGSFIDDASKQIVVSKLNNVTVGIGIPDYILDNALLNEEHENLIITGDDILENFLTVLSFRVKQNLALLDGEGFENDYLHSLQLMKPDVVVHTGLTQPPFFDKEWPWHLKYSNLGMIIASQLATAIDTTDNLSEETKNCFQTQYNEFLLPENGKTPLGDEVGIIGDNAGLQVALKAAMKELTSLELPGLNLTVEQLFFLNNAQLWCEKYTRDYADKLDGQTPGRFRVNGMLQNSAGFSEAFNCPAGMDMNPNDKCVVY